MNPSNATPALVGLTLAWGGTSLLVSPVARLLGDPDRLSTKILGQLSLWLLFVAILSIVRFWERQPLASLWLRPFHWRSIAWGLILAVAIVVFLIPAREWVRRAAGLGGYAPGMDQVLASPLWLRVLAVITAGIVEDTLFIGYTITRLSRLTGSVWAAGVVSTVAFAALHVPRWGIGPGLAFLVGGIPVTLFFIWQRDLLMMIVAHVAVDAWGIVITSLYSEWWKDPRFS